MDSQSSSSPNQGEVEYFLGRICNIFIWEYAMFVCLKVCQNCVQGFPPWTKCFLNLIFQMVPPGAFVPSVHHHRRGGLSTTDSDQSFNTRLVVVTILLFMVMSQLLVVLIVILLTAPWGLSQRINLWIDLSTIPPSGCLQVVFIFGTENGGGQQRNTLCILGN